MNRVFPKSICRLIMAAAIVCSQSSGAAAPLLSSMQGVVLDVATHKPLVNATVTILERKKSARTDEEGIFRFDNIEYGEYTLQVSYLGYRVNTLRVTLHKERVYGLIIHLTRVPIETPAVIVTGAHSDNRFDDLHEFSSVLKGRNLERDISTSLGSTLKNETGFAMRSMGPAPARPVIRGLGNDRITITANGLVSNDLSASSPDHAVSFEPFSVDRIEILRGPRVLTKNSSSIGGIINLIRNEMPEEVPARLSGKAGLFGESANDGLLASAALSLPFDSFLFLGDYSGRQSTDLRTPKGTLQNTEIHTRDYSFSAGYIFPSGHIAATIREFVSDYGIPGGFVGAHPFGVDISMFKRDINLRGRMHLHSDIFPAFNFEFGREYYHHTEYELKDVVGAEFSILTYQANADLSMKDFLFFNKGVLGISAEYRDFNIGGFVFTAPTRSEKFALYALQSWENNDFSFEFAMRYTHAGFRPRTERPSARNGYPVPRTFDAISSSLSAIYQFSPEWFAGGNISRSTRIPSIEELYSEGPHLAAYSYEIGNPGLQQEEGAGAEIFVYRKTPELYLNMTGFWNELSSYIIARNTGRINFNTLLPVYQSSGVNARLAGFEGQAEYHSPFRLTFSFSVSYTRGVIVSDNSPLPMIPPLKSQFEVKYDWERLILGAAIDAVAAQSRVDVFEVPTDGYVIANAFAQYSIAAGDFIHNISLSLDNVFNTEYRNHLSRVKSVMPEAGRNVRAVYRIYF